LPDGGDESACSQWADARDRHEPTRNLVSANNSLDLAGYLRNASFQPMKVFKEFGKQPTNGRGKIVALIPQHTREIQLEDAGPLANRDAVFEANARI
jgi:hypothetical protein